MRIEIEIPQNIIELLTKEEITLEKWGILIHDFLDDFSDKFYYIGETEFEMWFMDNKDNYEQT